MAIKKIFNISYLLPLSAFIVSLCAIGISIVEVRVMDEQKKASVWPIVFSSRSTHSTQDSEGSSFSININNSGVGPAIIKYAEVQLDDKIMKSWSQVMKNISKNAHESFSQNTLTNNVILPGREFHPFQIEGKLADILNQDPKRIRLKICYCSIYGECWQLDESEPRVAGLATPHKVEQCEVDIKSQFLG
ncbi:MAG: hypothetical protein MJK12_05245 [Colwellia sp.]|nr:hypothetical protein [Colwellia sp.]